MYPIRPPKAFMDASVRRDPRCARRAEQMLRAMDDPPVEEIAEAAVPEIVRANNWIGIPARTNQLAPGKEPIVVLNTFRFDEDGERVDQVLKKCPEGTSRSLVERLVGYWRFDAWSTSIRGGEQVCRRGYEWNPIWGCLHHCLYCAHGGERVLAVALNVEAFLARQIIPAVKANPRLTVWRYEMATSDALCVEPEYGATKVYVEYFATQPDRYFLVHTKSANVDHLLDLGHKGHTIMVWSLTSHTVSRQIEKHAGTTEERIEAARKCQQAGYPVRVKFKPIVPVRNWRDECRDMIGRLLAAVEPDVLGLCTLMWTTVDEMDEVYELDTLDRTYVQAAHDGADVMRDRPVGPFPDDVRAEIYEFFIEEIRKHNVTVPISLCTETMAMWQRFGRRLGFGPRDYVCGCGSRCTPGLRRLPSPEKLYGIDALKEEDAR